MASLESQELRADKGIFICDYYVHIPTSFITSALTSSGITTHDVTISMGPPAICTSFCALLDGVLANLAARFEMTGRVSGHGERRRLSGGGRAELGHSNAG